MNIDVVQTGVANLASVLASLVRLGATPRLVDRPEQVGDAERLLLPGVGAFGAAMARIDALGLRAPLRARIDAGRPTLTICLGLQVLALGSEETPGVSGLGVLDATVTRFRGHNVRVPQMGWNHVQPTPGARWLQPGFAYYANTFKLDAIPDGWEGALSDHEGTFVAAIERGDVLACQFHPELSGPWGASLLQRWMGVAC
jgi:glutamine amidotransferase